MDKKDIRRKPEWLKKKISHIREIAGLKKQLRRAGLHTVCESASCPNLSECFAQLTATFMILGDVCTRDCKFCNIKKGVPATNPDFSAELDKIEKLVNDLNYKFVTITSVTRDDIEDYGLSYFIEITNRLKKTGVKVEVLIPDLNGNAKLLDWLMEAQPAVINHNIEMAERLYSEIRPQSNFNNTLKILKTAALKKAEFFVKTGFMVGLGETAGEIKELINIISDAGIDILTIGQYLQPSKKHYPVQRYVEPQEFDEYRDYAQTKGIPVIQSAPFARSSYKAFESYSECKRLLSK